jgi:hypothetical protein
MAAAGHAVSALARGETLARVRERGLIVDPPASVRWRGSVAEADARALGAQELV